MAVVKALRHGMTKKFLCCFSPRSGAWIMALTNLAFTIIFIGASTTQLFYELRQEEKDENAEKSRQEDILNFIMGIIMGVFNFISGTVLVTAIIKGKEKLVLLYIVLELINLMIITIYSAFYIFEYDSFILAGLFIICIILWFGMYSLIEFYKELASYNSVQSGAIEITCNPHVSPPMGLPERAIESTAV